jgi:hypothetical protein
MPKSKGKKPLTAEDLIPSLNEIKERLKALEDEAGIVYTGTDPNDPDDDNDVDSPNDPPEGPGGGD